MENIYVTCKEANIEAIGRGIIELTVSVDAGQKDELLDNFTARDAIRHFGEDELLGEMDTDAIIDYLESTIGISIQKED